MLNTVQKHDLPENDFSFLALKAARQIDLACRGKNYDRQQVSWFVNRLKANDEIDSVVEFVKHMGPADTDVIVRALSAYGDGQLRTLDDLAGKMDQVINEFGQPLETLEKDQLEKLFAFCVTLHDEMLSQQHSLREAKKPQSKHRV